MYPSLLFSFIIVPAFLLAATENEADATLRKGDIKEAIGLYETILKMAPNGNLKKKIAVAYYRDQEHEKAFRLFLNALNEASTQGATPSSEELALYEDALKIYLQHGTLSANKAAVEILEHYAPVLKEHPEYYLLGFLVSGANANERNFEEFFGQFYISYTHYPEHYLAYKTKAILHIKLFERGRTTEEKGLQRQKIISNLSSAIERFSHDPSLYQMTLTFAPEEKQAELVERCLNKMMNDNIMVPRSDLAFYFQQVLNTKQWSLAQDFIDQAKQWYPFSRAIIVAERRLQQERTSKGAKDGRDTHLRGLPDH